MNLSLPPEPLTRRERAIALCVAIVCALTRFLAMSRSVWDWDEALFVLGMRHYDVTQHHPHPPGFPIYIAMGHLARFATGDDFRALQAINLLAATLLFPALFFLARDLRLGFRTSLVAAALFSFFPNVWFFGGGAFSDIPSIVLVLFAITLLFRGTRSRNAYWAGTFLLALAIGIRPQNLLLGLFPGLLATRKRRPMEIVVALLIGVTIVGAAFGGAIAESHSPDEYLRVVREHSEYISRVDSWRSPVRPPMWRLFDRFFIKQYQSPALSILTTLFGIASIIGSMRERSRAMLYNLLTFAPFALVAWAMLDRFSISRFSIGYQAMFALFAADGIRRVAKQHETLVGSALVVAFIAYTLPSLTPVRNEIAPSILAARAVAQRVDPHRDQLFVGHTMSKFMDLVVPGFPYTVVLDDRALPVSTPVHAWLLAEILKTPNSGFLFTRERGHLWNIARRHYFEIKLEPLLRRPKFVSGWYEPESAGIDEWRWMSGRSVTTLPAAFGKTMLRLHFGIPGELMPQNPTITVRLNGRVLESFRTKDGYIERDYRVQPAPRNQPNTLELSIDRTARPRDDTRALGLRLRYLGWGPS